jgi:hypothetical protein
VRSQCLSSMADFGDWLETKFSATLLVERELEWFIRWHLLLPLSEWEEKEFTCSPPPSPACLATSHDATPRPHCTHSSCFVNRVHVLKDVLSKTNFFAWCTNGIGYVSACMWMSNTCPYLARMAVWFSRMSDERPNESVHPNTLFVSFLSSFWCVVL